MSRVAVYSGPYGRLRGLGDDPSTSDVFSTGYNPMYPPLDIPAPGDMGVPYANLPAYSGPYPDAQPPLASTGYTPVDVTNATSVGSFPPSTFSAGVPGVVAAGIQNITSVSGASRPAPTVSVPLSPANLGLWFSGSSFGLPNWALIGGVLVGAALLLGGGGRRR